MTDIVRTTLSPACGSKIVSAALAALFALAGSANAQGLALADDSLKIESAVGNPETLLEPARLRLGNWFNGSTDVEGYIQLFDSDTNTVFIADALGDYVSVRLFLNVSSPNYATAIRLDAVDALITAGGGDSDGDLKLLNTAGTETVHLDGTTGTGSNTLNGNGFVKGWAQIDADGEVVRCYKCDPTKTLRLGPGIYAVDFRLVSSNVSTRPALATVNGTTQTTISTSADAVDPSRVQIFTSADAAFTVMIF